MGTGDELRRLLGRDRPWQRAEWGKKHRVPNREQRRAKKRQGRKRNDGQSKGEGKYEHG